MCGFATGCPISGSLDMIGAIWCGTDTLPPMWLAEPAILLCKDRHYIVCPGCLQGRLHCHAQAPAANHKGSVEAMGETFNLINTSPQAGKGFNRDYWARFERFIKELTNTCEDVYVVTGPLYIPKRGPSGYVLSHPMIGTPPTMMAVPTHFFKVVLAESSGGPFQEPKVGCCMQSDLQFGCSLHRLPCQLLAAFTASSGVIVQVAVGAFVMPNEEIHPDTPLTAFAVPLDALECVSGLQFFPVYLNSTRRAALDDAAMGWSHIGRSQLKYLKVCACS